MSYPLDGCWAKIERANENIKNLEAEISALFHPDPYIIAGNVNHQTKECIFVAKAKPIPLRFSVLARDYPASPIQSGSFDLGARPPTARPS